MPITSENRQDLERLLFDWSYKGVTDLCHQVYLAANRRDGLSANAYSWIPTESCNRNRSASGESRKFRLPMAGMAGACWPAG